jgi:hypothetical protein
MVPPPDKLNPTDLSNVRRYSIASRPSRTHVEAFGRPCSSPDAAEFLASLPHFLKATDLRDFISRVAAARKRGFPFHCLMGAHTIKVGLGPIIIDLMRSGIITGLSFNSAGIIHDTELALFGGTSEDVQAGLGDGSFGMVEETGKSFAAITALAAESGIGLGEATGRYINEQNATNRELSVFAVAQRLGLPVTVHVGIGTDIVAQHPDYDAAAVGAASHIDFRLLCSVCEQVERGGVMANIGSAVILPEVFLKALTVARNLAGGAAGKLTTANFDMIVHYRPSENVVRRPTHHGGQGYTFVGHHEIMIPLLAWGLKAKMISKR